MTATTAIFTQSAWPRGQDMTQRRMIIYGTLAIGASPLTYPLGGIPLTFAANSVNQGGIDFPGFSNPGAIRGEFDSRKGSGYIYMWTTGDLWVLSNVYAAGQAVVDTNGNIQVITTAGTSASTQPAWNTALNGTTTDNTAVWTNKGVSSGLIQIFQSAGSAAPLVEIAQATSIAAGISGDQISGRMEFLKG